MNKRHFVPFKIISILMTVVLVITSACLFTSCKSSDATKEATLNSLQKIDDLFYVLDYTYDYDIDDLMERGVTSIADMVAYGTSHILLNDGQFGAGDCSGACSTFNAITPTGDKIFGRNFDYYDSPCFLVWLHPSNGYASINMVNGNFLLYTTKILPDSESNRTQLLLSPYACMDGMNEKGLCIAILELDNEPIKQDNGKKDMTNSCILRAVLDKAATIDEAIAIFEQYDMHDVFGVSYHYQITDATGASVILEYTEDGNMNLIYPTAQDGSYAYQYLTNYYLSYDKEHSAQADCYGWDRTEKIENRLSSSNDIISESDAMSLLDSVHLNEDMDGALYTVVTIWSAVYNQTCRTVTLSIAMDYSKSYTFSLDTPCEKQL